MTCTLKRAAVIVTMILAAGCRKTESPGAELLPGRTRPILEHGWTHPRDLKFAGNSFQAPDANATLVTTGTGLRAYVIPAEGDPIAQIVVAIPLGPSREQ